MNLGINPLQSPADGISKERLIVSLVVVLLLHLLIFWLVMSPPTAPDRPKPPSFLIELGKAPPSGAAGQEEAQPPAAPAVPSPKAVTAPPTPAPAAAVRSPAQLPATAQPSTKVEQQAPTDSPAPTPATNTARAEPAEPPAIPGSAKASVESVRTAEPDYKAAYLNNPRPAYPRNAHRLGIEGLVVLQADVNEEGVPVQIQVLQSSGNSLLDESALHTVGKWRFSPARKDGVKVSAVVKIPITFSLKSAPRSN